MTNLDGHLVVFEGAARLRWERIDAACWRVKGLWPDAAEARMLDDWLATARPVLVILGGEPKPVAILREEWPELPATLLVDSAPDSEVAEILIPFLDWLPPAERERGRRFQQACSSRAARLPRLVLPTLIADDPPAAVRFAWRARPSPLRPADLHDFVRHVFA